MEKRGFIDALKELVERDDALSVIREVNELRTQFEDYLIEEERLFQIAEIEAKEKNEPFSEVDWTPLLKEEFYNIYSPYKEKQKALKEVRRKTQLENLQKKRALISEFKELIANEENIGAAFSAHKEINEKWKKIGDIPRDNRNEIQEEYSRLIEEFFYNMKIYKEIKDYDFKKNYDTKKDLINRLKELTNLQDIKEMEASIKQLQNEWDDIGPTKQEFWEAIKKEYWEAVNIIYDKIRAYYDNRRKEMQENIELKNKIIEKVKDILAEERDSIKKWNSHTKDVLNLQEEWKAIGFGPRKENEKVWKIFRGYCDSFFKQKNEFFKDAQAEFDEIAEVKKQLIEKVEAIKESTDWGETTKEIIGLQRKWKEVGNAGQKYEQILWKQFRTACDYFFNAKDLHFKEKDKEFEDNLKKKESLIEEIKNFQLPTDNKEAIEKLKGFSEQFSAIGFVPLKHKDSIYEAYKSAIYKHYEMLDIKDSEKEKVMFEMRINNIKGSGNSSMLFEKEKQSIRNEINAIRQQVLQFENNLGFFAHSKGANPLKKKVEEDIKIERQKIEKLKAKLKMIPNE